METYTKSSIKQKKSRQLEVGQRVFVQFVAKQNEQKKLAKKWVGPCIVLEKISPLKYKIRIHTFQKIQIVPIDNVITRKQLQTGEENERNPGRNKQKDQKQMI